MNYYGFISLFNGVVALCIGIFLLLRNRKNPVYLSFSVLTISIALWAIFYAVWQSQETKSSALFWMRCTMFPCYFIVFMFLWFVQSIIEENRPLKFPGAYLVMPGIFSLLNLTPLMIEDVRPQMFFPFWPKPGLAMHFCIVIYNLTLVYAFSLLFHAWKHAEGSRRWQLKWVTLTTLCMWAGGLTNWFLWYGVPIPPLPNFFVAIFLLLLAYAIIRRRLFDLHAVADLIQRAKLSALGMMAASLNHELRNPLFIAKGKIESHLDAVERGFYASPGKEIEVSRQVAHSALQQLTRAMDIMHRFSHYAKPSAEKGQKQNVCLREVCDDVFRLAANEFEMRKIKMINALMNGEAISANRREIEEIFFNLVMNACHAMGNLGGALEVKTRTAGDRVFVEISDTGPGIPKENQRRIFESFYTTKGEEGTGLGLYITKQLVEKNGGKISVKSKPDEGTTFALEFKR